jgi:hypothetical protein
MCEVEGLKRELGLERQADAATVGFLQRALRAATYWKQEAEWLERGDPHPTPNPMPIPALTIWSTADGIDGGSHVSIELVLATLTCLARLGEQLVSRDPLPPHPAPTTLLTIARDRLHLLATTLETPPRGG